MAHRATVFSTPITVKVEMSWKTDPRAQGGGPAVSQQKARTQTAHCHGQRVLR